MNTRRRHSITQQPGTPVPDDIRSRDAAWKRPQPMGTGVGGDSTRLPDGVPLFALRNGVIQQYAFQVGTNAQRVLVSNPFRRYLLIQNNGSGASDLVVIGFGSAPGVVASGIQILAGGAYEPLYVSNQEIWLMAQTGTQNIVIAEGV